MPSRSAASGHWLAADASAMAHAAWRAGSAWASTLPPAAVLAALLVLVLLLVLLLRMLLLYRQRPAEASVARMHKDAVARLAAQPALTPLLSALLAHPDARERFLSRTLLSILGRDRVFHAPMPPLPPDGSCAACTSSCPPGSRLRVTVGWWPMPAMPSMPSMSSLSGVGALSHDRLHEFKIKLGRPSPFHSDIEARAAAALHSHFESLSPPPSAARKMHTIASFIRAIGFFISRKVPLKNVHMDRDDFVRHMCSVGCRLPWQQFIVYARLPSFDRPYLLIELQIRGIFKYASREATVQINRARAIAKTRLEQARDTVRDHLANLNENLSSALDIFDDEQVPVAERAKLREQNVLKDENLAPLTQLEMQRFENKKNVAVALTECLATILPQDLQLSLKNPLVLVANDYRKRISPKDVGSDVYLALHVHVTAAKLGLTVDVLDANPGFFAFAHKNAIHRYLMVFNHTLRVNQKTKEISIMYESLMRPWPAVSKLLKRKEGDPEVITGFYCRRGLTNTGISHWSKLKPFIRLPPPDATVDRNNICNGRPPAMRHDWGDRYILEFCSWILDESPRLGGDHVWIRLKTPQGDIYSVGQYRPRKLNMSDQFVFPMKIKMCEFNSPDICEFWTGPYRTLAFEIKKEQFLAMKEQMEKDQAAQDHVYQIFKENCVNYVMSIARLAGIWFPTALPIAELLIAERVKNAGKRAWASRYVPQSVRSLALRLWTMQFNWIALLLGAGMISEEVKLEPKYAWVEPYIRDLNDFTNPEKVIAHHPWVIGEYISKEVALWRDEMTARTVAMIRDAEARMAACNDQPGIDVIKHEIDSLQREKERIRFAIPEKFTLNAQ
ncbi:hypothetical protein BC831DRAFT_482140 [Entophlyctis helioformis]|nr:hypothetical protein BC831DRAFT_482140 [Entophlyctis helioformis]